MGKRVKVNMTEKPILILVQRFKKLYWPKDILGHYTLKRVLAARPRPEYMWLGRDDAYDFGRVHYMYDTLKSGGTLDPVEIKWGWKGLKPAEVDLVDGHHRFVACVFAEQEKMSALVSGPEEGIQWLSGTLVDKPEWM